MTMRRWACLLGMLVVLGARPLGAQVLVGSCVLTSGSGSPESAVTGNVCDTFLRTDTGDLYQKTTGTGNTGWSLLPRVDAANVYTSGQQELTATFPRWIFTDSNEAADAQKWRLGSESGQFFVQAVNDALSVTQSTVFVATRAGAVTIPSSLTAGSGGVTIVNTAGKIPALTSTYFASLSFDAANLTGTVPAAVLAGRSLADLGTRSASDLSSGNLAYARMPSGSGTWSATPTISGALTLSSTLDVTSTGTFAANVVPSVNYTSNLGAIDKKFLAVYGAELQVETLVAASTMATIGGRILVAPTTTLTADKAAMISTPGAPTVTPQGVSGATTYSYKITALDGAGETIASSAGQTTTGNAVLSGSNFNRVTWSSVTGATRYLIYGRSAGSWNVMGASATTTFDDTGVGIGGVAAPSVGVSVFFVKSTFTSTSDQPYMESNGKVEWLLVNPPSIVALSQGSKQFAVVGDYTSVFTAGRTFVIAGSAGNNGTYTVVSSTTASFQTNITVSESIPSATVDGSISYVSTGTSYGYRLTRDRDGSGSNQWYAGDALLNTGTTGNGYIDLFSNTGVLSGNGPTIIGNVRTSATYNAIAARWAIGNLKSIYGYSASDVYGAAFGDPSATNITIDATNGLRIRNGTTDKLTADTSGNLSLVGDFAMSTSGVFRAGATAINTGTGWWLDYNAGTPRFRVGNPSGAKLQWDGSALTAAGWTLNASTITGGNATLDSTGVLTLGTSNDVSILSAADSTYRLWVGHATAGSAPFRVTKAGAATLTSVTINAGNVTLDSDGVTIGGAPSGFSSASMYKFTRPTGLGFGQSGDVYGTWFSANAGLDDIVMENKIVGTTFSSGTARVILKANGWSSSGGGASTGEAAVEVNSGVAQQRVTLSGDQVRFTATTSVQVTSAVFQVTNAAANLQVTDTTTTMSIQPGFFGTTSNHAWIALTNNGTNATFCAAGGITIGSPTGGCKGSGTLNATAVYDDNVLLTDWVFDLAYDPPRRTAEEWPPSTRRLYSLAEVRAITQVERRLPWMPSSTNFERERHTGGMVTRLYQGQEQQQLYLFDLETRIAALEQALGRR